METKGTFDPSTDNGIGFVGLIQFGRDAASDLGTTREDLKKMTALAQLDYVEKWIARKKDKITCLTDVYLSVLLPERTGKGSDKKYVLWDNTSNFYYNNPAFHKEKGEWENKNFFGKHNKKSEKIYKRGYAKETKGTTYMWEVTQEVESWKSRGFAKRNICKTDSSTCEFGTSAGKNKNNGIWHDPIDYPQITLFNSYGTYKPQSGAFGFGRNYDDGSKKAHRGLDLFAKKGTNVVASLDGEVVQATKSSSGYGNVVKIKVNREELKKARRGYSLQYTNEQEKGPDFGGDNRYLIYAHLESIEVAKGESVKAGDKIGTVGKTGNASNASKRNTHLHFEVSCEKSSTSDDYKNLRYGENPAYYVNLKTPKEDEQKNNTD